MIHKLRLLPVLALGSLLLAPSALAVSQTVDLGGAITAGTLASGNFTIGRLHFVVTAPSGFSITQTGGRLLVVENAAAGAFKMVVTADTGGEFGMKSIYIDQVSAGGVSGWGAYLSAAFGSTTTSIPLTQYTGSTTVSFTSFGYRTGTELVVEDLENIGGTAETQTKFYIDDIDVDLAAVAPTILSLVRRTPATSPTNADSLTWRLTFSEAVTSVDAADFVVYGTTATVTGVSTSGAVVDVTVSGGNLASLEGSVSVGISGAHSIVNSAGLNLTNLTPSGANENSYTVSNQIAPTLAATGNNPTFVEDGAAVDLFKTVTAAVNDSGQTFTALQLKVTGAGAGDVLQFGSTTIALTGGASGSLAGISGSYSVAVSAGIATISINGMNQTNAQMGSLVDGMTYRNTGNNPGSAARVVTLTGVTDSGTYFNSTTVNLVSTVGVTPVNDAPVLSPISPVLTGITEDDVSNAGQTVASFVGANISDVDGGAVQGIAITATVSGPAVWQYSVNAGSTWSAVGAVSTSSALLLRAADKIRCLPDGIHAGNASITYCAWDQTGATAGQQGTKVSAAGAGGTTAFSSTFDTAGLVIASAAPTTYADWAVDVFTPTELANATVSDRNADPDGVGVTNLLRYAFDLAARGPVSTTTTAAYDGSAATKTLTLSFPVRAAAVGLSYEVQSSQDLAAWTTEATDVANGVKRQVLRTVAVPAAATRFFLRLRVVETGP